MPDLDPNAISHPDDDTHGVSLNTLPRHIGVSPQDHPVAAKLNLRIAKAATLFALEYNKGFLFAWVLVNGGIGVFGRPDLGNIALASLRIPMKPA